MHLCRNVPLQNFLRLDPGGGALTKYLLQIPDIDFKAVEVDEEKIDFLLLTVSRD